MVVSNQNPFQKLVHIFQNEALIEVHGFDWFEGTGAGGRNDTELVPEGSYDCDYDVLLDLIKKQHLNYIVRLHNFDITKGIDRFFDQHKHLQFKPIFMEIGMYDAMMAALPQFWERLIPGGIMVFDQYSHELGPGETIAIRELLPKVKIQTIPNSWMPNAYALED